MKEYQYLENKYLSNKSMKEKQKFKNNISYLNNLLSRYDHLGRIEDIRGKLKIQPPNYNNYNFEKKYKKYIKDCEKSIKEINTIPLSMKVQQLIGCGFCLSIPISIYVLIMIIIWS